MPLQFYDIMAEDHLIYARKVNNEIEIEITDELDQTVYKELSHSAAWESLVYFSKQVLAENQRIEELKEKLNV